MYEENPDLEFCQNNNVLVVRFGENGRLAHRRSVAEFSDQNFTTLVRVRCDYRDVGSPPPHKHRVWAFIDYRQPGEGHEHDPYWWHVRGVSVGSVEEGYDFLVRCRRAGLTTRFTTMEVPFSNGQRAVYNSASGGTRDFLPHEVAMADTDFCTVEELIAQIKTT
jgi:hypothetical protein